MHFCYRHPTYIAKRRCYQCHRYICPNCQVRSNKHIFCGTSCIKEFIRKKRLITIWGNLKKPLPLWLMRGLFYFGLVLIILLTINLLNNVSSLLKTSYIITSLEISKPLHKDISKESKIKITKPADGMKTFSPYIKIEGEAPSNSIVALYINGELADVSTTHSTGYSFDKVLLLKKENVIQVRAFTDNEAQYSKAIMVYYIPDANNLSLKSFSQPYEDNFLRGNLYLKELALTFDAGSTSYNAKNILDILRKYNVKATFFLTGEFIEKFPDIVKEIAMDGHEIGNHTYSHPHLTTYSINKQQITLENVSKEFLAEELKKTDDLFYKLTKKHLSPFWRAPYGESNPEIRRWASELGYTHIGWTHGKDETLDSMDWITDSSIPQYKTAEEIISQILDFGKNSSFQANGGIILMHLGSERKQDSTDQFLPYIIEGYIKKGYKFVPISRLIRHKDDIINSSSLIKE